MATLGGSRSLNPATMVRIRKKTSNRITTAHRAKIKHKTRETKKKNRKEAKRNPHLHRKKKKKDPGIPNSFPYKEQILAEVAESRKQAIEERRSKASSKGLNAVLDAPGGTSGNDHVGESSLRAPIVTTGVAQIEEEMPLLVDTTIPSTAAALQAADVVITILDARDPLSYRSTYIEGILGNTPLLYVLNKIDLVPREAMASWITHLRQSRLTFLFRSASACLPADPIVSPTKPKAKVSHLDALGRDVLLEALHAIADVKKQSELTIAIVGVTNVGKSSFINSLIRKPAVNIYNSLTARDAAPSTTPYPQSVALLHKRRTFNLIDTPGLSFIPPSGVTAVRDSETRIARDVLLRNRGNISKIKDPLPAALYILSRTVMEDMIMLYNLPTVQPGDFDGFLASFARKEGALLRRGDVDFQAAARALVRDWKTGRLAFYTLPPPSTSPSDQTKPEPLNLVRVFEKSDERMLSEVLTRKGLRKAKNGLVQLKGATADERQVDLEANVDMMDEDDSDEGDTNSRRNPREDELELSGSGEESEDEELSADSVGDDSNEGDTGSEEDSEEEEDSDMNEPEGEDEEPAPLAVPLKLSGKRGRVLSRAESRNGKKSSMPKRNVSFAPYTKAGMKLKAKTTLSLGSGDRTARPSSQRTLPGASKTTGKSISPRRNTAKGTKSEGGVAHRSNDAYDFSKYF